MKLPTLDEQLVEIGRPVVLISNNTPSILSVYLSPSGHIPKYVRFEVFTAVSMKNGVFWDVTPCGSSKNRRFWGT
jgi:hypothetical protein